MRLKRPELNYAVTALNELSLTGSSFDIDGTTFSIPIAGLYNIYNALAAYSAAKFFGLSTEEIQEGFLVSGILIPMIVPVGTPLWMVGRGRGFLGDIRQRNLRWYGYEHFQPRTRDTCLPVLCMAHEDEWRCRMGGAPNKCWDWDKICPTDSRQPLPSAKPVPTTPLPLRFAKCLPA